MRKAVMSTLRSPIVKLLVLSIYILVISSAYISNVNQLKADSNLKDVVELNPSYAKPAEIKSVSYNAEDLFQSINIVSCNSTSLSEDAIHNFMRGYEFEVASSDDYSELLFASMKYVNPLKESVVVSENKSTKLVSNNTISVNTISRNSASQVTVVSSNTAVSEDKSSLSSNSPDKTDAPVAISPKIVSYGTISVEWNGGVLTKQKGVNQGPSGKETYYSLPMDGVIKMMRAMGNNDEHWIREDGVHMLGDYVMVAANLNLRPRGSYVETSLGIGCVCDTGGFADIDPTQIDIATIW